MKNKLKENKILFILLCIIVVGILLIFYGLVRYFYLGNGTNKYGERLDGIENYKITEKNKEKVVELYKDISSVGEVKVEVSGRIIYITVDFVENIKLDDAKGISIKSLDKFSDEIKSYYDIQYILTGKTLEKEGNLFPTMGSKSKNSSQIIWVKS